MCRRVASLGGVGVAGFDRREDLDVLLPADQAAAVDEHREHQLGLRPQRLDGGPEVAVVGGALDRQVELTVGVGGVDDVVGRRRLASGLEPVADLLELIGGAPLGGELGGERLEHAAQLEQLDGPLRIERGDVRTAARPDLDEPGVLERPDRFAHRVARHAELFGETVLEQPLAGLELTGADHLPDLVGDDLTQRAVSISESAR